MARNSFGKSMLLKMGWNEGKGLGKDESGMSACIVAVHHTRLVSGGTGRDWFEKMFDDAASN
ncbi:MAG: hypothetical protein EZS28_051358, partial [Streblomastix strix]